MVGRCLVRAPRSKGRESSRSQFLNPKTSWPSAGKSSPIADPTTYDLQGATLEDTEKPSCKSVTKCTDIIAALPEAERPIDITGADPKCRFFWKMSDKRTTEAEAEKAKVDGGEGFKLHDAPNVVPKAFEGVWEDKMEDWGMKMKTA